MLCIWMMWTKLSAIIIFTFHTKHMHSHILKFGFAILFHLSDCAVLNLFRWVYIPRSSIQQQIANWSWVKWRESELHALTVSNSYFYCICITLLSLNLWYNVRSNICSQSVVPDILWLLVRSVVLRACTTNMWRPALFFLPTLQPCISWTRRSSPIFLFHTFLTINYLHFSKIWTNSETFHFFMFRSGLTASAGSNQAIRWYIL